MWSVLFYFCVTGACLSAIITVLFPTMFSVVCINACLRGESKEIQKTRDGHQFFQQFRKARMSLSAFRPKPLIGKIFVHKRCFCLCFFHTPRVFHIPCFPLRARVIHTPRFPHLAFSRRFGTLAPRFPPSRNGHDFTGGFAQISRVKKDFCYFIWYVSVD